MKKLILPILLLAVMSSCTSVPKKEELISMKSCMVVNDDGLFSSSVEPEASSAKIKTSKCSFGFWGCAYTKSEISKDGAIMAAEGSWSYERKYLFGQLNNDQITFPEARSAEAKLGTAMAETIGSAKGPIVIDRKHNEVNFPMITYTNGKTQKGKSYSFSSACSNEQVAVGTATIDALSKLSN